MRSSQYFPSQHLILVTSMLGLLSGCFDKNPDDSSSHGTHSTLEAPGKPTFESAQISTGSTIRCSANYSSSSSNGTPVTATLSLYNAKAPNAPRATQTGSSGRAELNYTLKTITAASNVIADADVRGDQLYCTVATSSGGSVSDPQQSVSVTVADTSPTIIIDGGNLSTTQTLDRLGASITSVQLRGSDADGDSVSYVIRDNTCGSNLVVDSASGLVSGTIPSAGALSNAVACAVRVDASANGLTSEYPAQIDVSAPNNSPTLTCTNSYQTLASGAAATPMTCTGGDIDVGTTLAYSLSGCSALSMNASTGAVSGTMPPYGCSATATVTDGSAQATQTLSLKLGFVTIPQGLGGYTDLPSNTVYGLHVNGSTIYAATGGGVGKSTDGGTTWSALVAADGIGADYSFDVNGSGSDLYVASHIGFAASHDGGTTWSMMDNVGEVYFQQGRSIEVIGSTLLYDGEIGLPARSTDKGATWTNMSMSNTSVTDFYVDSGASKVYASTYSGYATHSGGVQLSVDNGATWNVFGASTQLQDESVVAVAANNNNVYVALNPINSTVGGIAYSTDNGANWTIQHTMASTSDYVADIYVDSNNTIFLATTAGLLTSNNNGASWTTYAGLASVNELVPVGTDLWLATGGYGVKKTVFNDLNNVTTYAHSRVLPAGKVAADSARIYASSTYSTDGGATWNYWSGGGYSASGVADVYLGGSGAIHLAASNGLSVSTDNGANWTRYTTSNGLPQNGLTTAILHNSTYVVGSSAGVSLSATPASSWSTKTTAHGLGNNEVNDLASDGTAIYAATSNGLAISTDNGATWTNTLSGIAVYSVAVGSGKIYAGAFDGLRISANGGSTWTTISSELPNANSRVISTIQVAGDVILLGTYGGLVISPDAGQTWVSYTETDGIPARHWIDSVALYNGTIYLHSYYAGVAKSQ